MHTEYSYVWNFKLYLKNCYFIVHKNNMNRQTYKSAHVPLSNADGQRIKFKNAVLIETCNHIAVVVLANVRVYVKAMTRRTKCEECMCWCMYIRWQTPVASESISYENIYIGWPLFCYFRYRNAMAMWCLYDTRTHVHMHTIAHRDNECRYEHCLNSNHFGFAVLQRLVENSDIVMSNLVNI